MTNKPRITVTLTPEVHALLKRMSQLTGNSQSSFVGDLLTQSAPVFSRMVEVLEAAERLRGEALRVPDQVKSGLDQAQSQLEAQLGLVLEVMDDGFRPLLQAAEKVQRRARRRSSTPLSNRGVRSGSGGEQ